MNSALEASILFTVLSIWAFNFRSQLTARWPGFSMEELLIIGSNLQIAQASERGFTERPRLVLCWSSARSESGCRDWTTSQNSGDAEGHAGSLSSKVDYHSS